MDTQTQQEEIGLFWMLQVWRKKSVGFYMQETVCLLLWQIVTTLLSSLSLHYNWPCAQLAMCNIKVEKPLWVLL